MPEMMRKQSMGESSRGYSFKRTGVKCTLYIMGILNTEAVDTQYVWMAGYGVGAAAKGVVSETHFSLIELIR